MKRTDLLLCGVAALLALPVYRGWSWTGGHHHHPKPGLPLTRDTIVQLLAPLDDHAPPPESDRLVRGEDSFDGNSLGDYTGSSDGGNGGRWTIRDGALAIAGPARQSVLTRNGVRMADGWVEAVSSRADDGGLVLRYLSGSDYYLLAFRDDSAPAPRGESNLAIYHHFGWDYRELWRGNVRWPRGTRHAIRFEAEGARLRAYFDGGLAGEVRLSSAPNDPSPYFGRGGIGVRSHGLDSTWVATFAAFRWKGVDRKP